MQDQHKELFQEISIGGCRIKNRYVMAPMGNFGMTDDSGIMSDACVEYYVERARGGVGLIITGMCIIEDRYEKNEPGAIPLFSASVNHSILKKRMQRLTDRVHAYNCKIFLQMSAGFGRAAHIGLFCNGAVAPSAIPNRFKPEIIHRLLTVDEIQIYIESFAREAAFAKSVGFDGVEIHALHEGYLLDQFSMEIFNHRQDQYGGTFENRYRFSVEILEAIKKKCGSSYPVSLRYSPKHCMKGIGIGGLPGEAYVEKGRDMPEGIIVARYLEQAGYDALDVDLGSYDSHFWSHPPVYFEDGMYLDAAEIIKKEVHIPVIVSGRMDDPDFGASAIRQGKCDMVALGRPLLADPGLPNKVRAERTETIRPCISCNYGCSVRIRTEGTIGCAVNAECALETVRNITPAVVKKKIVVIGGGPAGMEFARVASQRGHDVILLEMENELGGQLIPASKAPFKYHDRQLINWFQHVLSAGTVKVCVGQPATREVLLNLKPDCVVFANGAVARRPDIPGADRESVFTVADISMHIEKAGNNIVIIGAGQTSVELGIWLCSMGKKVTILSRSEHFMKGGYHNATQMARQLLERGNVDILYNASVDSIQENGVEVVQREDGKRFINADTVVMALGFETNDSLYCEVKDLFDQVYILGDAVSPRNVYYAIHSAYEIASSI